MKNKHELAHAYWKENLRYMLVLLAIWFSVSFGAGIVFKEALDSFSIGGFRESDSGSHSRAQSMCL